MNNRRHDFRFFLPFATGVILLIALPSASWAELSRRDTASFDRGRRDLPKLALTFDGGSDAGESESILEVLRCRGVRATFFLTGDFIRRNPGLTRRIVAAGHEVGNHTSTHPHLTSWQLTGRHETLAGVDQATVERELADAARAFVAVTGKPMLPLWRAPYGEINREILAWAARSGWRHVGWTPADAGGRHNLDSLDWVAERSSRNYLTSAQMTARIRSFGAGAGGLSGGIVLMHLSTRREDPEVTRLGELIDALRVDGYRLVTVSELQRDAARPDGPSTLTAALSPEAE